MSSRNYIIAVGIFLLIMVLVITSWIMHSASRTETTMRAPPTPSDELIKEVAQDAYRRNNLADGQDWILGECVWGHGMMPWTIDVWFRMDNPSRRPGQDPSPRVAYQYVSLWYSNKGWLADRLEASDGRFLKGIPVAKKGDEKR